MQMRPWLFPLLIFLTISCRGIIPSPTDAAYQQYLEEHGMTPEDEDVEGPATLTGRVLDSEGQPLEHGRVLVYRHKPGRRKSEGPMAATELEGPDREFRFVLNAPMSCFVYVDPDSIPPGSLSPPRRSLAEALKDGNGTVRVVDAAGGYASLQAGDEAHVELVVGRPGRVVGRLVDREGEPIAEALVDIGAGGMRGTHHERTTTDEQGRFRLDPVFPGHLRLIFFDLSPQRNPPPVDFRLHGGQTAGNPLGGGGGTPIGGGGGPQASFVGSPFKGTQVYSMLLPHELDGDGGTENVTLYLKHEVMDTNSLVGLQRMLVLRDKVDLLLLGNVPSPLPRWADKVFFCSIKRITTGQNSGDVLVTVGTKGTDITAFSLDINNSMPYADLDDIMETQLGQWVLGSVVIEVSELEVPMMEGVWTTNTLVIDWSSDVSGAVTESHVIDLVFNP